MSWCISKLFTGCQRHVAARHRGGIPILLQLVDGERVLVDAEIRAISTAILEDVVIDRRRQADGSIAVLGVSSDSPVVELPSATYAEGS